MTNRIPSSLAEAAKRGDVAATEAALSALEPGEPSLAALFAFTNQLGAQPTAAFAVLHHVAIADPPEGASARRDWLRALNNACAFACAHGTSAQRTAIAERALEVAAENVPIFHNAACLFCVLGRVDDALACVAGAAEHGYEHMAKLADDPDLELVRERPEFARLVGAKAKIDREERARRLAALSRELFRGEPVPDVLAALWQEAWSPTGTELPSPVRCLHETREAPLGRLDAWLAHPIAGPHHRRLFDRIDLFADDDDARGKTFVGYYRGRDRQLGLGEAPIVEVCASGAIRVAACSLYEYLVIANHDRATRHLLRVEATRAHGAQMLENLLRNASVSVPVVDVERAREAARAIKDDPLADLADELGDAPAVPSPALAALASRCGELGGDDRRPATFVELHARPWRRGALARAGGPCIGVADSEREAPLSPLVHLMTLDVPLLAGDARAVAVLVNLLHHDRGTGHAAARLAVDGAKTALVTDASIAAEGARSGPLDGEFQELPRAVPVCVAVEVAAQLLADRARGLWAALDPRPADDDPAVAARFLVWNDGEARVAAVPSGSDAGERFFAAVAKEYERAGHAIDFPVDAEQRFGEWLKELELEVEEGPPELSLGGRRERYAPDADVGRVAVHRRVMSAWFEPAVAILAQLLAHPSRHVRFWTALSITGLFEDHVEYDMYSESVGDHFRSIAGEKLARAADANELVSALVEGWSDAGASVMSDALVRAVRTLLAGDRKDTRAVLDAAATAVTFAFDRHEHDGAVFDLLVRLGKATREHDGARARVRGMVEARGSTAMAAATSEQDPERASSRLCIFAAFGDHRVVAPLCALVGRVPDVERAKIVDALRELKATEAIPALVAALPIATERGARCAIVHALSDLGDGEVGAAVRADILSRPLELERHASYDAVMDAACKAARAGAAEARTFLVTMLERGHTDTTTLRTLGALGANEAVPALIDLAANGPSYDRGEALGALADIGDPRAERVLFAALVQREDEWLIQHGARGMRRLGITTPEVVDALVAAAGEKNHRARIEALEALGDLGVARGLDVARANIGHGHDTIARTAAVTLQQLAPGSPDGIGDLLEELAYFKRELERGHLAAEWKARADRLVAALARAPATEATARLREALAWYVREK